MNHPGITDLLINEHIKELLSTVQSEHRYQEARAIQTKRRTSWRTRLHLRIMMIRLRMRVRRQRLARRVYTTSWRSDVYTILRRAQRYHDGRLPDDKHE